MGWIDASLRFGFAASVPTRQRGNRLKNAKTCASLGARLRLMQGAPRDAKPALELARDQ